MGSKYFGRVVLPFIGLLILSSNAIADAPIVATPGSFSVSNTGAAQYTVPIQVPPGTAGMVPSLSLSYSSQGNNGMVGVGWNLSGLPSISRCPNTIATNGNVVGVSFWPSDAFCYAGQHLMPIGATSSGANSYEFRTETETFTRFVMYVQAGGNAASCAAGTSFCRWEAWTKAGQHLKLGTTGASQLQSGATNPVTMAWSVDRVSDLAGNYMTVTYNQTVGSGEIYPSTISYTGNSGQAPYNTVNFVYESRSDSVINFQSGAMLATNLLLTNIQTFTGTSSSPGTTLVTDYQLGYETSSTTQRSLLHNIKICGGAQDNVCLQPTLFNYTSSGVLSSPTSQTGTVAAGYRAVFGNFDGSGRTNIMWVPSYGANTGISSGRSNGNALIFWLFDANGNIASRQTDATSSVPDGAVAMIGDFNGDGYADIFWYFPVSTVIDQSTDTFDGNVTVPTGGGYGYLWTNKGSSVWSSTNNTKFTASTTKV